MGQAEAKSSKNFKNDNEYGTIEIVPSALKTFASLLSEQPTRLGPREFSLSKDKDIEFTIKTNKDAPNLTQYQGFLQVYQANAKIFEGNVNKMRREGFGVEFDANGRVFYRGEFADDLYHGWGQTVRYQGEFKQGRKEGWGRWEDHERNVTYEGSFKDDRFHGIGYLNLRTQQASAFMVSNTPLPSSGKISKKYAGDWLYGRMHGNGKLATYEEIYQGGFEDSVYNGEGVLNKNGKTTASKFYNGAPVQ